MTLKIEALEARMNDEGLYAQREVCCTTFTLRWHRKGGGYTLQFRNREEWILLRDASVEIKCDAAMILSKFYRDIHHHVTVVLRNKLLQAHEAMDGIS